MTLGTTHASVSYDGDGTTTEFAVTFEFHATSDLEVIVVTEASGAESVKAIGIDYDASGGSGATGTVTMTDAPQTTERLVIRRVSSDVQPDDLVEGGPLAAEPLERRLDIIAARLQELEADIARSLKVTKGSQATALDLNLVGGKNRPLSIASDEQGIIIASGTVPGNVQTSPFGENWVSLSSPTAGRNALELGSAAVETTGSSGARVPLLNGNNIYSGASVFAGDTTFNSDVVISAPFALSIETLAIDGSGELAPSKSHVHVSNGGGLSTIAVTNHPIGAIIELRAGTAGQTPILRHEAPGSGNIYLADSRDVVLDDRDKTIWLQRRDAGQGEHGPGWYEIGRSWRVFPANSTVQTVVEATVTEISASTAIPFSSAVPQQSTEGTKVLEAAISARFSTSKLLVGFSCSWGNAAAGQNAAALFIDSTEDAAFVSIMGPVVTGAGNRYSNVRWIVEAATTSTRIYKVHVGANSGTMQINRGNTVSNLFGAGKLQAVLTIEEIAQ